MFALNRVNRNALTMIVILLLIISALAAFKSSTVSKYQPRPITTKTVSDQSIFDLPVSVDCVAGSGKKDSPYSRGLTPGGVCGAQKLVSDQAGYEITDGIGGSLI